MRVLPIVPSQWPDRPHGMAAPFDGLMQRNRLHRSDDRQSPQFVRSLSGQPVGAVWSALYSRALSKRCFSLTQRAGSGLSVFRFLIATFLRFMSIVVLPSLIPEAKHVSPDVYINAQVTAECVQSIDSKHSEQTDDSCDPFCTLSSIARTS